MEFGRPREFFIGRYIYLNERLDQLPIATISHRGEKTEIAHYVIDRSTGEYKRRRISDKNPQWEQWVRIAVERETLKEQLKILKSDWKKECKGSLEQEASAYRILKPAQPDFNPDLWDHLQNNQNRKKIKNPFMYKGIIMRSQFETVIASIIDDMHLEFKYDTRLDLQKGPVSPDFAINMPEYRRCGFMEFLGALKDHSYVGDNAEKFENYISSGLYINRDIIFLSGDKNYRPDYSTIRELICVMVGAIARRFVVHKDAPEFAGELGELPIDI